MKKWRKTAALILAAAGIAAMLPAGTAQALKAAALLETQEQEAQAEEEAQAEQEKETQKADSLSVTITDNISEDVSYKNDRCVRKVSHTVTLTGETDDCMGASYEIYQSSGGERLAAGTLELPSENKGSVENVIEMEYESAGGYYIIVSETETDKRLAYHEFSIEKANQDISLKEESISLSYGESIGIGDFVAIDGSCQSDIEIWEDSGEKSRILEIGDDYIKATGINGTEYGETSVVVRLAETPLLKASEEKRIAVTVQPVTLRMEAQAEESAVYMYDTLAVAVTLSEDGENVTQDILSSDGGFCLRFLISSETESYEVTSDNLKSEADNSYVFYIPVENEYFKEFSDETVYSITAELDYADDGEGYIPYQVNAAKTKATLLGRSAAISLSAEDGGVYDYRTWYQGAQPVLFVELEDTTDSEGGADALSDEAKKLVYTVSSSDAGVVEADASRQYTAENGKIPLCINGVGTAVLTVEAAGGDVYEVEGGTIEIEVKNSPLSDKDFVISTADGDFCAENGKTGFEKWEEYIEAHDGWLNSEVKITLTKSGAVYYEQLCLSENGSKAQQGGSIIIGNDCKKTEYELWAENDGTNADTGKAEENGTRSFTVGIDTAAPKIERLTPSTNYYAPTSSMTKQYFSKSFVLTGTFTDENSGIAAIEYTTELDAPGGADWTILEAYENPGRRQSFSLSLGDGSYGAVALRAVDAAGNVSEEVRLTNGNGELVQIVVDSTPPRLEVSAVSGGKEYSADNESWTNQPIQLFVSEAAADAGSGLCRVEYAYQSIADALCGAEPDEEDWQELSMDDGGTASFLIGGDAESPVNQNGYYYFRAMSRTGVMSEGYVEKRVLLWQEMEEKAPLIQTGASAQSCYNGWYNIETGTPIIDFEYPKYDTGVSSGEYAAPITLHYNMKVTDENESVSVLAEDKTAEIRAYADEEAGSIAVVSDDLSRMRITFDADGIYTLEYWTTDAAGNKSETEIYTYKIDCTAPEELQIKVDNEERELGNESGLVFDRFYQNSVSGEASAEYGISGKESLKLLKAKAIGEWEDTEPDVDAEHFTIDPCSRCLLYIRAVDGAGNVSEGWTRGLVVDNEAPAGDGGSEIIIEPEGANEHGFFNKDVEVSVSIKDAPADGNSSGLKLVTACVGADDADTISEEELFSSLEEVISESRLCETESFSCVQTIDAAANEGNEAYITVSAADRSGNISVYTQELKIDVTKPEIEIIFDNENALNGRYYSEARKAQIRVKELNFDASLVEITVNKNGVEYTPYISEWRSENDEHYAYVDFTEDGDYTLTVDCTDLADNEANQACTEMFTIDRTAPKAEISLEKPEAENARENYFNEAQTVVITVTEHNFNEEDFEFHVQPSAKIGKWEHKNDTHVIKLEFLSEGEYSISYSFKDLAGNELSDVSMAQLPVEFIIDMTQPELEIAGVADNSANSGEVVPVIYVRDANIEQDFAEIALRTGRGEELDIGAELDVSPTEGGFCYVLNGLDEKADNVYYLTVNAVDKAGNVSELTYRFSLNRRGSAYDIMGLSALMEQYYNSYSGLEDLQIIEMNVDKLEDFELYLSYNANIIYGKNGARPDEPSGDEQPEAAFYNVSVSGNEDTGYVYTYTLYRENFALEGTYRIGIYSKDAAGNEVNNLLKQNGEEIQFVIDNTPPRVVIDGLESNGLYDEHSHEISVVVEDNYKLEAAQLILVNKDGETLESWDYFDFAENEGDTAVITIGEHNEEVSLLYWAADAAGNEICVLQGESGAKEDFLVTTDKLAQLVNKPVQTPIGRTLALGGAASMSCAAAGAFTFRRFRLRGRGGAGK